MSGSYGIIEGEIYEVTWGNCSRVGWCWGIDLPIFSNGRRYSFTRNRAPFSEYVKGIHPRRWELVKGRGIPMVNPEEFK